MRPLMLTVISCATIAAAAACATSPRAVQGGTKPSVRRTPADTTDTTKKAGSPQARTETAPAAARMLADAGATRGRQGAFRAASPGAR